MNLKKIGKVFTSKFVGTGPSSNKKLIYRAAVSQTLRNTGIASSVQSCWSLGLQPYCFQHFAVAINLTKKSV